MTAAYRALCDLGRLDSADPILLFRRTRQQAGLPRTRRVHLLPVRLTPDAIEMHRSARSLRRPTVAGLPQETGKARRATGRHGSEQARVLQRALACRVRRAAARRRSRELCRSPPQWRLPFDTDADPADEAPSPSRLHSIARTRKQAALRQLLDAATARTADERKVFALRRLLRRVREPVIVFTEYRDTLEALEAAVGGE